MLWQLELFESQQRTGLRQLKLGVARANTWESWIKPKYRRWNFRMASRQIRSISLLLSEAVTYHQFQGLSQLATRDSRRQQDVLRATFMLPACWSSLGTLHPKTHSTIPGEKEEERYFLIGFGWFISISHPRPSVTSLWVFTGNMSWCPIWIWQREQLPPPAQGGREPDHYNKKPRSYREGPQIAYQPPLLNWAAWLKWLRGGREK